MPAIFPSLDADSVNFNFQPSFHGKKNTLHAHFILYNPGQDEKTFLQQKLRKRQRCFVSMAIRGPGCDEDSEMRDDAFLVSPPLSEHPLCCVLRTPWSGMREWVRREVCHQPEGTQPAEAGASGGSGSRNPRGTA